MEVQAMLQPIMETMMGKEEEAVAMMKVMLSMVWRRRMSHT
jgi:hypothetical protein